jgi:hypothetical protein
MPAETRELRPFAAEIKFLVTPDQGMAIREWARARLTPDPHGSGESGDAYTTTTLYCETAGFDVFRRRGSYGRSKYRIRRYATSDIVFLERKLRTKEMLSKRRSLVRIDELGLLGAADRSWPQSWSGAWFGDRLSTRRLTPVCQVAYDRIARLTNTPYGIARLTLDANLRACPAFGFEFQSGDLAPVLPHQLILEMKFRMHMPAVFKAMVDEFQLNAGPVSKYRASLAMLGLATPAITERTETCRAS